MTNENTFEHKPNNESMGCPGCHTAVAMRANQSASSIKGDSDASGRNDSLLCSACVRVGLCAAKERHETALAEWTTARQACTEHFAKQQEMGDQQLRPIGPSMIAELQDQSQSLRKQLERLKSDSSDAALRVYTAQVNVQERHERLKRQAASIAIKRETMHRLHQSICASPTEGIAANRKQDDGSTGTHEELVEGALVTAIRTSKSTVRSLRFQWALQGFQMHRLQVEETDTFRVHSTHTNRRTFVSGIGKIGGLPLPHAGPELFGVLPAEELQSALRLVAQLTNLSARCLGIWLPHPILLRPPTASSDNTNSLHLQEGDIANMAFTSDTLTDATNKRASSLASSISAALHEQASSLLGEASSGSYVPGIAGFSTELMKVQQRVRHAVSAVIAEDQSENCSTFYALSAEGINRDEFAIALQLLQNNVIALCIRAGVPVGNLWPGEALLLNLHALHVHCQNQAGLNSYRYSEEKG